MIPFFSPKIHPKEHVLGRAVVTAAALLFLMIAALHAFPSKDSLNEHFRQLGLSGYSQAESSTASAPIELDEFYDHPLTTHSKASDPSV